MKECSVCYGKCNPKIHRATVSLHEWFRERLLAALTPVARGVTNKKKSIIPDYRRIGNIPREAPRAVDSF